MENETPTKTETNWGEVITKAEETAKRIEEGNKKAEELLNKHNELQARQLLGGKTDAVNKPEVVVVESPKEYSKRVLSGRY